MMMVRRMAVDEMGLLVKLFSYKDVEGMIAANTKEMTEGRSDVFGLFQDEELIGELHVGYINEDERYAVKGRRAYLFAFRVRKDLQGRGYGQRLVNEVLSTLCEEGYTEFTIGVMDDNERGRHIYFKLGFTHLIGRMSEEFQGKVDEFNLYLRTQKDFEG